MAGEIIIIGGGLAGLSAGCHGRMRGFGTRIFELASTPGGLCTAWKRGGYTFDGCISWLVGTRPDEAVLEVYRALGILDAVRLRPVDEYMRYADEPTGRSFSFTSDYAATRAALLDIAPGDKKAIDYFLNMALALSKTTIPAEEFTEMPLWRRLRLLWEWRRMFLAMSRLGEPAAEFAARIEDPWARRIIRDLFDPNGAVIFHMMTAGWLFGNDMSRIDGGDSLEFSRAIERKYLALGGEIRYNAPVSRIIVEGSRAVGVELDDGTTHRADYVISASDLHQTLYKFLGGRFVPDHMKRMFDKWSLFSPIIIASFGVRGEFPPLAYSTMLYPKETFKAGAREVDALYVRDFGPRSPLAPEGCRVVQAFFETDFESWQSMRAEGRDRYNSLKEHAAAEALKRVEYLMPGISRAVEVTDVATPATFYRYSRNHMGSYEGWLMNMEAFTHPVEKTLPGLERLYLAGQWVQPGGGVPTALLSGRKVINMITRSKRQV